MHQITPALPENLDALRDFAEYCFRAAYETSNEPEAFQIYCAQAFSREKIREEMSDSHSEFWLVWEKNSLAAYMKLNFNNSHPDLGDEKAIQVERIYVAPEQQGKGLGAELLAFAEHRALQSAAMWTWLSVWKENPDAVRFYLRCGYEIFGIDIFYLADDPQEDWAMKKRVIL